MSVNDFFPSTTPQASPPPTGNLSGFFPGAQSTPQATNNVSSFFPEQQPKKPTETPFQRFAHTPFGRGALKVAQTGLKTAAAPLNAFNAVAGLPQRGVSGLIGAQDKSIPGRLGSMIYEELHPNQEAQFTQQGEKALGFDKIFNWALKYGDVPVPLGMSTGGKGGIVMPFKKMAQLGEDVLYENMTDPVNALFLTGFARRNAAKYAGTALGDAFDSLAKTLEYVPSKGAQAYQAIPGAVEGGLNRAGLAAYKGLGKLRQTDLTQAQRAAQAAQQSVAQPIAALRKLHPELGPNPTIEQISKLPNLGQQPTAIKNLAIRALTKQQEAAKALEETTQKHSALGTQIINRMRVAPHLRRGMNISSSRGVETMENYAHDVGNRLDLERAQVLKDNEMAIEMAQAQADAANTENAAKNVKGHIDPILPPAVRNMNNKFAYYLGSDEVKADAVKAGFNPTDEEKQLPTLNVLTSFKPDYIPEVHQTESEFGLLPAEEKTAAEVIKGGQPGFTKHQFSKSQIPLLDKLSHRWDTYINELSGSKNMLAKALALHGGPGGWQGLTKLDPDIEQTQRELQTARMAGSDTSQLEQRLAAEQKLVEENQKFRQSKIRPGEELVPMYPTLEAAGVERAGSRGQALSRPQIERTMHPQALKNLGLTPEWLEGLGVAQPGGVSKSRLLSPGAKALTTERLGHYLRGRRSTEFQRARGVQMAQNVARRVAAGIGKLAESEAGIKNAQATSSQIAEAGQRGIKRTEFATPEITPERGGAKAGRLQASAARTAQETAEAAQRAVQTAIARRGMVIKSGTLLMKKLEKYAKGIEGPQTRALQADMKILDEIIRREKYNQALDMIKQEVGRLSDRYEGQIVPKSILLHEYQNPIIEPEIKGFTLPTKIQKALMFMNPLVHGPKNIGSLQTIGPGGFSAVMRAFTMTPELEAKLNQRLSLGALAHYQQPLEEGATGLQKFGEKMRGTTESIDTRLRTTLLDYLDHADQLDPFTGKPYKSLTDVEKNAIINEELGEYGHTSEMSKTLQKFGVPFPHWRFSMVAHILRSILTNPHRVNLFVRNMMDFNRDMFQGDPYELGFYTPVDTGLEGLDPLTFAKFVRGLHGALTAADQMTLSQKLGSALTMIPGVGTLEEAFHMGPFQNKATKRVPGWQAGGASLFGSYFKKKPMPPVAP